MTLKLFLFKLWAILCVLGLALLAAQRTQAVPPSAMIACSETALSNAFSTGATPIDIPSGCTITLTADLPAITSSIEINGGTINGGANWRPFTITGGGLTLNSVTIEFSRKDFGSVINVANATVAINNSHFEFNGHDQPGGRAGVIYADMATIQINGSSFDSNFASTGIGGVGYFINSTTSITNSSFFNNFGYVGGVFHQDGGTLNVTNSTFSRNETVTGAGVLDLDAGVARFTNSTLSGQIGRTADTFYVAIGATLRLRQNIIAEGSLIGRPWIENSGIVESQGYNLLPADDGISLAPTDIITASAGLEPYANGVYLLTDTSPARDAVPISACAVSQDQRGESRPQGTGCDIGAVEMPPISTEPSITPTLPPAPTCDLLTAEGIAAYDLPDGTYCRVLMRENTWIANPGSVPQSLIDTGVILAVDVFVLDLGHPLSQFHAPTPICLEGSGRLIFLDAQTSPRQQIELPVFIEGNFSCGFVGGPGTLVLIYAD